ncbi:MAG: hypothetical protein WAT36_07765 [Chromatiaceae bacterium]
MPRPLGVRVGDAPSSHKPPKGGDFYPDTWGARRYQQIGKLQVEMAWLKKIGSAPLSLAAKRGGIEPGHPQLSIVRPCALLRLSRACDYRGEPLAQASAENLTLMRLIDEA